MILTKYIVIILFMAAHYDAIIQYSLKEIADSLRKIINLRNGHDRSESNNYKSLSKYLGIKRKQSNIIG